MEVFIDQGVNFSNTLIQSNPTLMNGAKVTFYNPYQINVQFEKIITSTGSSMFTVETESL